MFDFIEVVMNLLMGWPDKEKRAGMSKDELKRKMREQDAADTKKAQKRDVND